ncbi:MULTISPECIES: Fur family transcriptional regulator [unclassified Fusibacter]|uniref:Fur family transcriptional regulator n=1 Tax=unclassified Fusibacter TaxID=2624464 RepID=UPI00101074D5|nr:MULTISPECIES: Fur family transcriptional regulator [unclassified Fusibacter]MCK8060653.1 transcriptional repressor [Fusibacter sp. A2]NPE22893.1 transcriptional repressor [Fusibacter sp. A1]RXV59961.1 transcriptional repressor [Fusibacter sp. A1]
MTIDYVLQRLKEKGFKLTDQRELVVHALVEHQDRLMTVENLLEWVREKHVKMNMTTIYRNLEALESIGILHKTMLDDQTSYYKLTCGGEHHHHFICMSCGKITNIDYCPMDIIDTLAEQNGFDVESHKLEVYGLCKTCKK